MSETKTSKKVYDALIAAGVQVGDLVRFNDETTGFVYTIDETNGDFNIAVPHGSNYYFKTGSIAVTTWPTHFARPYFGPEGVSYENISSPNINAYGIYHVATHCMGSNGTFFPATKIEYSTPDPLTLEQRIERLEKLQGIEK